MTQLEQVRVTQEAALVVLSAHLGELGLGTYPLSKKRKEKVIAAMLAFAEQVRIAAEERCARIAEAEGVAPWESGETTKRNIATAIREQSNAR